jgi:hypothetical protein
VITKGKKDKKITQYKLRENNINHGEVIIPIRVTKNVIFPNSRLILCKNRLSVAANIKPTVYFNTLKYTSKLSPGAKRENIFP